MSDTTDRLEKAERAAVDRQDALIALRHEVEALKRALAELWHSICTNDREVVSNESFLLAFDAWDAWRNSR